jgi:DNA-binding transcriptional LysR family regulator
MTQPAVSRHVARLESGLGVTLLKRTKRQVDPTPEGRAFLGAAREFLAASRRAVEVTQLASRGAVGQIHIGSAGTFPNALAGRLVTAHRRDHSAVEVQLSQWSYVRSPTAGVDRGRVDAAIVRSPVAGSMLEFKPLVHEPRLLALPKTHRLARRGCASLEELSGESVVSSAHWAQRVRDYWAGVDDGADPAYEISVLADSPGEWLDAIAQGRGLSLCPASIAGFYRRGDLGYVPVAKLAANLVGLAWRHDQQGPLVRTFVDRAAGYLADQGRDSFPSKVARHQSMYVLNGAPDSGRDATTRRSS